MSNKLFENLRIVGTVYPQVLADPQKLALWVSHQRARLPHWTDRDHRMAAAEMAFGARWINSGQIVYNLSHSLAAMFAITSAPPLDWEHSPHEAFVLKVPRAFLPLDGKIEPEYSYIYASREETLLVADWDTTAALLMKYPKTVSAQGLEMTDRDKLSKIAAKVAESVGDEKSLEDITEKSRELFGWIPEAVRGDFAKSMAAVVRAEAATIAREVKTASPRTLGLNVLVSRFISNVIAYLTEHRAAAPSVSGPRSTLPVYCSLTVPVEVIVDRAFRDAARDAVASTVAGSVIGIRRALAHHVRGHWRNQAHGAGHMQRRLKWIMPHRRGNESLGSVIRRVEHLDIPTRGD